MASNSPVESVELLLPLASVAEVKFPCHVAVVD